MITDPQLIQTAQTFLTRLSGAGLMVACAESCTGGLISAALTAIAGSSSVVERGFVTYSNDAKTDMLGVPAQLIATHGAVSAEVAIAMAQGALSHSRAHLALSVTGIAGPGGGSPGKPVGLVHFAAIRQGSPPQGAQRIFSGDRDEVRRQAALFALTFGLELCPH